MATVRENIAKTIRWAATRAVGSPHMPVEDVIKQATDQANAALASAEPVAARHLNAYHEDYGSVLWWTRPVTEPPYVGAPGHSDWPGYHRWWTRLPHWPVTFEATRKRGL